MVEGIVGLGHLDQVKQALDMTRRRLAVELRAATKVGDWELVTRLAVAIGATHRAAAIRRPAEPVLTAWGQRLSREQRKLVNRVAHAKGLDATLLGAEEFAGLVQEGLGADGGPVFTKVEKKWRPGWKRKSERRAEEAARVAEKLAVGKGEGS